jgi:hypothetical protein
MSKPENKVFTLPRFVSLARKAWKQFLARERDIQDKAEMVDAGPSVHMAIVQAMMEVGSVISILRKDAPTPEELEACEKRLKDLAEQFKAAIDGRATQKQIDHEVTKLHEELIRDAYPGLDIEEMPNEDFVRLFQATVKKTRGDELKN